MSKCEFVLAQPINIIADVYTVDYGLIEGIYYPYMIMKKLEDGTLKDIVYGGEYKEAVPGMKRIREMKSIEEVVFPPVRKVMDIENTEANMALIASYIKNKGVIPDVELRIATSDLKEYMNRVDFASGETEKLDSFKFKKILAFTLGDIYNANMNACFDCECRIERRRHK